MKKFLLASTGLICIGVALLAVLRYSGYYLRLELRGGLATETRMSFVDHDQAQTVSDSNSKFRAKPKNLILLIGDGMGFGQVLGARAALVGMNGRLEMERMPITGWVTTHSARRLLTDSAAGATALSTGFKTDVGRLATAPDGRALRTLMEAAAQRGKAVGLVTDSYLWDATPAAFAGHLDNRREYTGVAAQMATSGFDLLLGEEDEDLEDDNDTDAMLTAFVDQGFRILRDANALSAVGSSKDYAPLLGLFDAGSIHDAARNPALSDLAAYALDQLSALDRLSANASGFALLVETEETDTASHRGDFERMTRGVAALDQVVRLAVDFARRDGNTLVVVTADHDTGGLSLIRGREGEPLHVRWATGSHTGNPVPLFAYGAGAQRLGGVRDNTEVARILAELLDLDLDTP